ncbi:RCC1-like G exchanging factor-like protein isoform X6 [Odocoileus virginianus]|uniref:RCC1-like G exchanging factor-like protein isoform X6 n=1 Tax=Odocoileus virginianus TaxID=9874 RepID=A0ABM4HL58_ODOVR
MMGVATLAAGARLGRWLSGLGPGRGHWTAAGRSRSRREAAEAEADAPVFQYVGERATRADRIFVWGFSFSGALGVPTFVLPGSGPQPRAGSRPRRRIQAVPYRLELDQKISSAACGYGFTLLSSKTKDITKVWGMGLNKDSQLGFHRSQKDKTRGYEYVLEPSPVLLPLDRPQETRVLQVSCGRAHSLVLTDGEGVFSMGNNSYGQCGRKVVENEIYSESHTVHRMQDFDGQVVQVACGQDHSLFLTDRGEVYSCGWGADGQTDRGELFVWGKNIRGCLGIGRLEDQYFPWRLQAAVPPTTAQRREAGDVAPDQHEIRQPSASIICFFFHFNEHFTKYKIYCLFGGNIRYFFSLRHTVHESRGFCVSSRKKESVRALGRAALFSPCPERGTDRSKCHWYCW